MSSVESGTNPDISKVHIAIQEIMTFNSEESELDHFRKGIQTQLAPALEGISVNIQHLEINQVRSLGSINSTMPPSRTPVISGLNILEDLVKGELTSLAAKIYSKSVCVQGRWFGSLDDCILFYQKYAPEE